MKQVESVQGNEKSIVHEGFAKPAKRGESVELPRVLLRGEPKGVDAARGEWPAYKDVCLKARQRKNALNGTNQAHD